MRRGCAREIHGAAVAGGKPVGLSDLQQKIVLLERTATKKDTRLASRDRRPQRTFFEYPPSTR